MASSVVLAAGLALLSAVAFAVATVAQQRAAARSSDAEARGLGFVWQLLRRPQWWAGTLGNTGGYGLQAVALGVGSLLVVQPILVTSLLFALPLGARLSHRRLARAVWVWGAILVVALALFVTFGHTGQGLDHATPRGWLIAAAIGVPVLAACLVTAHSRSGATRASLLAIVVGLLAGALAVLTKGVASTAADGVVAMVSSPELYALVVVGLAGVYVQQLAFQAGELQASLPIMAVLEPIAASVLGLVLLDERLDTSGLRLPLLIVTGLAMTLATIALARGEAAVVDETLASSAELVRQ